MSQLDILAQERRARLAAERLLELKQAELFAANKKLSSHARNLSDEIIVTREETQTLKVRNEETLQDLEKAHHAVDIAERRLWDSLETIHDGFAVYDPDDVLIAANSAYLQVFDGLADVRPGAHYRDIITLAVEEGLVDTGDLTRMGFVEAAMARWNAPHREPHVMRLWNNQFVKLVDQRSRDGDTVSLGLNITATVRSETRLKKARSKAESANRAKSAFLANMTHEIRTPMNGVVGMAELLADTALSDEQKLYVDTIKSSGEALLLLINDVLDYSKIEASKLSLHYEPFDFEKTVHEVVTLLQPSAAHKKIDLIIDYDMFLPTRYVGDRGRLRQVLMNLVGNAVKFTRDGHVVIRVVGLPDGDKAQRVHVSVEDTGIGIAPDMVDHIFGEFNQVEDERNRKFEGTGLGLAITRQLVSLMGGEIWVDSDLGQGSVFGFHITMDMAEDAVVATALPSWMHSAVLIDPQATGSSILAKQLDTLGFAVSAFASATEMLASRAFTADIYLVDSALPDRDVVSFIRELRSNGVEAPVLVMTSGPISAGLLAAERAHLLHKPLLRADFLGALARVAPEATVRTSSSGQPRKMRVLAAEDNKTNQLVFGKMLKSIDIELKFAENGREAIALYQSFEPDLIFMDISMPDIDGKEATRAIRALEEATGTHVPIVALTAHAMAGDDAAIMDAGLDYYMTKPLRKAAIIDRILAHQPADSFPLVGAVIAQDMPRAGNEP
ncbi:Signal transduction histidine-protein kinase BarA [Aquimixticola soesokkakensis]|uniref:Sensory/regulatory protein RpfC n=1 Tax=Aquimixticola soesokkakensis TaxID=1519096 RepID=A0A1Y5RDG5_9RHOB|nr:ATP-binding protein [Aquimixticola soesokkakensis]SLN14935.1 Signal transduction histidine-protein kinase BarA [Aquimixticola soesokkakensis]